MGNIEQLILTIDKEVKKTAKEKIPNVSEFVENCFKHYLGLVDGLYPTGNAREIMDNISKLQVELYFLNETNDIHENMKKAETEKLNVAWRGLWFNYAHRQLNDNILNNAVEVLGVDKSTLYDILDFVEFEYGKKKGYGLSWESVYSEYKK